MDRNHEQCLNIRSGEVDVLFSIEWILIHSYDDTSLRSSNRLPTLFSCEGHECVRVLRGNQDSVLIVEIRILRSNVSLNHPNSMNEQLVELDVLH